MSKRSDPGRTHEARRGAVRSLMIDEGRVSADDADEWIAAWDAEAIRLKLQTDGDYWTIGSVWIAEQRRARRSPAA